MLVLFWSGLVELVFLRPEWIFFWFTLRLKSDLLLDLVLVLVQSSFW